MRVLSLAAVFLIAAIATVSAQQLPQQSTPEALTSVYQCANITDDAQRLACFDGAVGRLRSAETQGQIVAVDRNQAASIERESFGFHLPTLSRLLPNLDGGDREINNVQMVVERIRPRSNGTYSFVMEGGQVWSQVEVQSVRNIREGDTVRIENASLGSFRLIGSRGGNGHRVRREN